MDIGFYPHSYFETFRKHSPYLYDNKEIFTLMRESYLALGEQEYFDSYYQSVNNAC